METLQQPFVLSILVGVMFEHYFVGLLFQMCSPLPQEMLVVQKWTRLSNKPHPLSSRSHPVSV